jgi:hypothetical protein
MLEIFSRKPLGFALPIKGTKVPASEAWIHEVKYDGYRMMVIRENNRVRLMTKGGYDWAKRYPWIVEAALKNRHRQFVLDGEAVILGVDGISDFNALHSSKFNHEVQLLRFRRPCNGRRRLAPPALLATKNKPRKAVASAAARHLHGQLRTRRDRSGSFPESL